MRVTLSSAGITVFVLVLLSGCARTPPPTRSTLAGPYEAVWKPYGTAYLDLKANGTYEERFVFRSGRTIRNAGQWDIDSSGGSPELVLHDSLDMNDVLPVPKPKARRLEGHLGIRGSGKGTRVVRDPEALPDEGCEYVRK